jgi:hypothetical protein
MGCVRTPVTIRVKLSPSARETYLLVNRAARARGKAGTRLRGLPGTAPVHEAYFRLVGRPVQQDWDGRGHLFAAAAEAMRRILIYQARRRQSQKRGGDKGRVKLDAGTLLAPANDNAAEDRLALEPGPQAVRGRRPGQGPTRQAALLRRPIAPGSRRRAGDLSRHMRSATGSTPARGFTASCTAAERSWSFIAPGEPVGPCFTH